MGPVIFIPYEGRVDMYDDAASWCCRALTCIVCGCGCECVCSWHGRVLVRYIKCGASVSVCMCVCVWEG
jgi:hypothetical protein